MQLTTAVGSVSGGFIISDLDAGQPLVSFTATFKALIGGGTGADGMSFNFANDLPNGAISEEGAGNGLIVEFDTYANGAPDTAPSIDVKVGGAEIATMSAPGLRANTFVDVIIQLHPDGTLAVIYDGLYAYTNLDVSALGQVSGGRFGFGARTGGATDNHFIDNLGITTQTTTNAFVQSFGPEGRAVNPDAVVNIGLADFVTSVNTNKIQLVFDGVDVTSSSSISQAGTNTFITYDPPGVMASASTHAVSLTFADNAAPTPKTNTFQYGFTVIVYSGSVVYVTACPSPSGAGQNATGPYSAYTEFGAVNAGSAGVSTVSDAPPRDHYRWRGALADGYGFWVKPQTSVDGGIYKVEVSTPGINGSTNIRYDVTSTDGNLSVANTIAFQAPLSSNKWSTVGYITNHTGVTSPKINFTWHTGYGTTDNTHRLQADAFKFTLLPSSVRGTLTITQDGTDAILDWAGQSILQSSLNVTGPYYDATWIPGPGPYTNSLIGSPRKFFRLRN